MKKGYRSRSYRVNEESGTQKSPGIWIFSCRFQLTMMGFLGTLCLYLLTSSMGVAVVCMTYDPEANNTLTAALDNITEVNVTDEMLNFRGVNCSSQRFPWSRNMRGWILSSFYIGYVITQLPAGWLAKRFGAKLILGIGMTLVTVMTFVTPAVASTNVYFLMAVQGVKGAGAGTVYPVFYHILASWAPPTERSLLVSIYSSGAPLGTILSSIISGFLCRHGYAGGWPSIFYTFGAVCGLWCIIWYFVAFDSPEDHPRISQQEKEYILSTLGHGNSRDEKEKSVPWKKLLTTWPVYAIFIADMCYAFGWFVSLNSLPQYMKDVLKFDIKQNGLFSALPYLSNWIVSILGSITADFILTRKILKPTGTRKLFETLGMVPSTACALGAAFLTCWDKKALAVLLVSLWVGFLGFIRSATDVNQMELAPKYAGIIMGLDQTLAVISGIIAPPLVGLITKDGTPEQWRIVFILTSSVFLFGWFIYVIFASAEEAEWSKSEREAANKSNNLPDNNTTPYIVETVTNGQLPTIVVL